MGGTIEYKWIEGMSCPECRKELAMDKITTSLKCANDHHYPMQDGIPVFVDKHDFDNHWDENFTKEIPETKVTAANDFFSYVKEDLSVGNIKVLDAGCGDGAQAAILQNILNSKSRYYGIDISLSAVKYASLRVKASNASFINSDVAKLPFINGYFDAVFSFGVLAYTPDPHKSFKELHRILKPGGLIGIWIYPKATGLGGFLFSTVRKACKIGGKPITALLANLIVPFMGLMPTKSKMSLRNTPWKQCREIVMVNIAPQQLYFPEPEEIQAWFEDEGIEIIANDKNNPITIWGKKKA